MEDEELTNAEIAKLFVVSTSSMMKHADNIREFVIEMYERSRQQEKE